jgi:hypothetical protein
MTFLKWIPAPRLRGGQAFGGITCTWLLGGNVDSQELLDLLHLRVIALIGGTG